MAVKNWLCPIFFVIFVSLATANPQENVLNVPKILLPYVAKGSKPTTFVLKAQKGCFRWISTKPNVALITPINGKSNQSVALDDDENICSQLALVEVKLKTPEEDSTVILAEEDGTGFTLRCDVFVDSIHHIEIATTTRKLLLGESPEVFDLYAYDLEGNLFTSLGSQKFDWSFSPVPHNKKIDPRSVLRFLWFQDSSYETTSELYELEEQHLRGCSALVEGVNTGEAIVTAKLSHPDYKHVNSSSVMLTVIDNVMLVPPVSYIMIHQIIKYNAQQLRRGAKNDIHLPSEQYTVKVVDSLIGELNHVDASVYGKKLGNTKIQLIDKNMADLSTARRPSASLHVVEPSKIGFAINPGKQWILQTGRVYEMHVLLFDDENNRIEVTDETIFSSALSKEYFEIFKGSNNGSYYHVQAQKPGKTILTATLEGISYPPSEMFGIKHLYGEKDIEIYDPIVVTPEIIVFPWDATIKTTQVYKHELNVQGGSGVYRWLSKNTSFATVNKKGMVVAGNAIGSGEIKVSDVKNPSHFAVATVMVLPPHEIIFGVKYVEVEVGSHLELPLAVSAFIDAGKKDKMIFEDCRKMQLDISFSDAAIFKVVPGVSESVIPKNGCSSIIVEGLKVGHTSVTASYTYGDVMLKATVVIGAYKPVTVLDPAEYATVTLGSKKTVIAEGGPLPWILDSSGYYQLMSAEEEEWVQISHGQNRKDMMQHQNVHYFNVLCTQLGEQLLTIEVGNKPTAQNQHPATSSATARFLCTSPVAIKLVPVVILPMINGYRRTLDSCQDNLKRIPIRNNRRLKVNVIVTDAKGNLFDDTSSLRIQGNVDNRKIANLVSSTKETMVHFEAKEFDAKIKQNDGNQAYFMLDVSAESGPLVLTATILGYQVGNEHTISPKISTQLNLLMVSEPRISPNKLSLFAHSSNKLKLNVGSGTENFILESNDNSLASLQFVPPETITVAPQEEGQLTIYLHDACLDSEGPAEAHLTLSDVSYLQLAVEDKVEVGQHIEARCQAIDRYGNVLSVADVNKKLELQLKMTSDIVSVRAMSLPEHKLLETVKYNLTGRMVGVTSITCQALSLLGNEMSSKAEEVQVFSAIQLEPKHVLLIVGSIFQIHSSGGPRPQSTTSFSILNQTVADVSQSGLVTARVVGKTIVTGKAKGVESLSGKEIIYSQDQTIVEVIQLKGFKILLKSRNIASMAEIGILCVGITDESPFTFASSVPYLRFHWSTSNHKVAVIDSAHFKAGVSVKQEQDFRAVLRTFSPGQVTIKLNVEVLSKDNLQVSRYAKLEDRIQVQVYDELAVLSPSDGKLLLPHHAHFKIQTNRDQSSRVTYAVLSSSCQQSGLSNVIHVASTGQISTFSSSGTVNVQIVVHEDFGFNQTAVIQVEVKPVGSLTLVPKSTFVVMEEARPAFPIGANAVFKLTLHDSTGRLFDVANIPLKHRVSRSDIVHIVLDSENATFSVRGASVGETFFKVWDKENSAIYDYIRIKINEGIRPKKLTIPLGAVECFTANVRVSGRWSSSGNPISIGQKSGIAVGMAVGSTMIYYNDEEFSTHTEVTVTSPTVNPSVADTEFLFITNALKKKIFFVTGDTHDTECVATQSYEEKIESPFSCNAVWEEVGDDFTVGDVFQIDATYDGSKPVCRFVSKLLSNSQKRQLSTHDRTINFVVHLNDKKTNLEWKSELVQLRFIPDIYIDEANLVISSSENIRFLDVFGSESQLSSLKVSNEFSGLRIELQQSDQKARHRYKLTLVNAPTADTKTPIKLYSPITKVTHEIPVAVRGEQLTSESCRANLPAASTWRKALSYLVGDSGMGLLAYTIIIATVILMLLAYHAIVKSRQNVAMVWAPSPYVLQHQQSPPPYVQHSHSPPAFHTPSYTPGSYPKQSTTTPQRTLFSVSQ